MNNKRTGRFYRKNEIEVMEQLGLIPTKGSGSGWLEKEDGYNDIILCQLKSTDAQSISVKQQDLHTLRYNATVSHKTPVFAIQFLNTEEVWLMAKPEDFPLICKGLQGNERNYIPDSLIRPRTDYSESVASQELFTPDVDKSFIDYLKMNDEEKEQFEKWITEHSVRSSPRDREKFFEQQQKGRLNKKRK